MIPVVTCSSIDDKFTIRVYDYDKTIFKGALTPENCKKIKELFDSLECKTVIYSEQFLPQINLRSMIQGVQSA